MANGGRTATPYQARISPESAITQVATANHQVENTIAGSRVRSPTSRGAATAHAAAASTIDA